MNRFFKISGLILMLLIGSFLYACGAVVVSPKISVDNTYLELRIGEEGETKSVDIVLSDYKDTDKLAFSTDNPGLVDLKSTYLGSGKTRLHITGVEPGTVWITITSLQGGATKAIEVKVIEPIKGLSFKNEYKDKIYAIRGDRLDLNNDDFYNFLPKKTNEKDLTFEILDSDSGCTIENGILIVGESALDKITIKAKSKNNENIEIEGFDVYVLQPISLIMEAGYGMADTEVGKDTNNIWDLYIKNQDESSINLILTIAAGKENESLLVEPVFASGIESFKISQTGYEFINNYHKFIFNLQPNSLDAEKTDDIHFKITYENFTIGEKDYSVKSNAIKVSSYNSPESIRVNQGIGEIDLDVFENSKYLINGRLMEFTILPGDIKKEQNKIRIWTNSIEASPIYLYKLNATRNAYILLYGYDSKGNLVASDNSSTPYLEIESGEKIYAFVSDKYNSTTNKNVNFYAQAAIYYDGNTEEQRAFSRINFTINPNAEDIFLASEDNGNITVNNESDAEINLDINSGNEAVQYIAVKPSDFVIGSSSNITISNANLATVGKLTFVKSDNNYAYAKFTIKPLNLGSTKIKITLSDGTSKTITLNIASSLNELEIKLENLNEQLTSDIIAFTDIYHTRVDAKKENSEARLNKVSIANSGSGIKFLKTPYPANAQYRLDYAYLDYDSSLASGETIENITMTSSQLKNTEFTESSNILNTDLMKNYSIIHAKSSRTEGVVLLRINVYGVDSSGRFTQNPVGSIYYMIHFFIPVSGLNITNGNLELYPYYSIGDRAVNEISGMNLSRGNFSVAINTPSAGVSPTYIDNLEIHINGALNSIEFENNICYLDKNGEKATLEEDIALQITRTRSGNVYSFQVQSFREASNNYVLTFVVNEINGRKITGIARIFIKEVNEITDFEISNVDKESGIYFNNEGNKNNSMKMELVANLFALKNQSITNNNLYFDFEIERGYENSGSLLSNNLIQVKLKKNGNYELTIDKKFSGYGKIVIYPESDYFRSGRDETGPILKIPFLVADGKTKETAIRINHENDFKMLNNSSLHFSLENNLFIENGMIEDFKGYLYGNGKTISVEGPLFRNIKTDAKIENLNIIALPRTYVEAKGYEYESKKIFGFFACLNEGTITDVNMEASTTHLDATDLAEIDIIGLFVGVNKGTITYTDSVYIIENGETIENKNKIVNIVGDILNIPLNIPSGKLVGGVVGCDEGEGLIEKARIDISITNSENMFAGNKQNAVYIDEEENATERCAIGGVKIEGFAIELNPNDLSEESFIASEKENTMIMYYYNVINSSLNNDELAELRKKNSLDFNKLFRLYDNSEIDPETDPETNPETDPEIDPETNEENEEYNFDIAHFRMTIDKKSVAEVIGNSLKLNGVGKVELTIEPKYAGEGVNAQTIIIYVIYPIQSYEMYKGTNTEVSANRLESKEALLSIKKSGTTNLVSSFRNTIPLNGVNYVISQNSLALELFVKKNEVKVNDFNLSGSPANYNGENDVYYFSSTGIIAITPENSVDIGMGYTLFSKIVLQQGGVFDNDDDSNPISEISALIKERFYKEIPLNIFVGAEKIESSVNETEIDPSTTQSINIKLTTDAESDGIRVEFKDSNENLINDPILACDENLKSSNSPTENFELLIYVKADKRGEVKGNITYVAYVYATSTGDVFLTITINIKPQDVNSITYSHYNRDDESTAEGLVPSSEPSSILAAGDNGLLVLEVFPNFATYSKIVIESEIQNGNYVLLEQMYKDNGRYFSASGKAGYSSSRNVNILTINYNDNLADGLVYIRTKISDSVLEGSNFPLTIKVYKDGVAEPIKIQRIHLVSQIVDGATITVDGEKEAVVVRGFDSEIKISVPEYQDLADYSIKKHSSGDALDIIGIYVDRGSYEIINGRKIFTGRLSIGLNAEIYDDGEFEVEVIVSRVINGRIESSVDKISIKVVDFLIKGIHLYENNEEDNIFNTPLAIEKELRFKFILTGLPSFYSASEHTAYNRILNAQQYFLDHMAYKYANEKYSYVINTDRTFAPSGLEGLTHIVSELEKVDSIVKNLYYTNSMNLYVDDSENDYLSIRYDGFNNLNMDSNLLKITGKKTGMIPFTLRIPYKLPKDKTVSYLTYKFFVNVQIYSDEDKPTPIYNEEEFIEYLSQENNSYDTVNYILMENITLSNYIPFETTNFDSFDGNNKVITIKNFNISNQDNSGLLNLALFKSVDINSTLKNITLNLYELNEVIVNENIFAAVNIAGIAIENYGIIYNCEVVAIDINNVGYIAEPGIKVFFDAENKNQVKKSTTQVNIAGLVINNDTDGCITNSRVGGIDDFIQVRGELSEPTKSKISHKSISIIGQGDISGFIIKNKGVISASFFANGKIMNNSTSETEHITSAFVIENEKDASINGSYSKGIKLSSDTGPYITGGGIVAQGIVSGFVYLNEGHITDSYSNIKLAGVKSGIIVSGFVYNNKGEGLLERCYSASTISGQLTTQRPFTGINTRNEDMQEVKDGLINCYYIVNVNSSESAVEKTGAIALGYSSLSQEKLYGFSFVSGEDSQDGSWRWTGIEAELVETNNIAISVRGVVKDYDEKIASGSTIESIDVFPYYEEYKYGSARNPIIIRTADEYNRVFGQETSLKKGHYYAISEMYDKTRKVVFGNYRLVSHIDFEELSVVESVKITSSVMNLSRKNQLKGVFDGNGLTISNIEITLNNNENIVGLISKLSDSAVLKNVNLEILKVASSHGVYVGGAVGQLENSSISNIQVIPINVEAGSDKSSVSGFNIVGGVVGLVVGSSRLSNITSSISVNSLYKQSTTEYDRFGQNIEKSKELSYAGGIVGVIDTYDRIFDNKVYTSKANANKLKVYGKNISIQGKFVGGIAGYVGQSTYLVDALFEISGKVSSASENPFNQKLISYGNNKYGIGQVETAVAAIGGIAGVNYGNLFEVRIEHESETQKNIENNIEGYYNRSNSIKGITTLFNGLEAETEIEYIGGLVGMMRKGEIHTSYSKVDVVSSNAKYAGGIIGYNEAKISIFEVFVFGDVDARISGGLIGYNKGEINLSLVVAMNLYNKDHSRISTAESSEPTGPAIPVNIGSIVGRNVANAKIEIGKGVYAVKKITLNQNKIIELAIASSAPTGSIGSIDSLQELNIKEKDMGKFDKVINTITTNQMFLNAGWDSYIWKKDEDRVFPYFSFGLASLYLYIEKPSDFAKIFQYSNQSNEVIIGNDPNTLFNPYEYDPTEPTTFYENEGNDLRGLEINKEGKIFTIDLSEVEFAISGSEVYFDRFLGKLYGQMSDWTYIIKGFKKSIFGEIIGGEIRNIVFVGENKKTYYGPVLARSISAETRLIDLQFKDINITSTSESVGIMANVLENINVIRNVEIENCSIISTSEKDDVYVGGLAGKLTKDKTATNFSANLEAVKIKNLSIKNSEGAENKYCNNLYVGMIFGEISTDAIYDNCVITGDVLSSRIEASSEKKIFAGGFAGSASSTTQQVRHGNKVENLYILIGETEELYSGLLFGEGNVNTTAQNGTGPSSPNSTMSGLITNKYKYDNGDITTTSAKALIAHVGGFIGSGSGNINGIKVKGVKIGTGENEILIDLLTKSIETTGSTTLSTVGGFIGNATSGNLKLWKIDVKGDILVKETKNSILIVGGLIGQTGNTFEILSSVYSNKIDIKTEETTVYVGGLVGYADTGSESTGTYKFGKTGSDGNTFSGELVMDNVYKVYAGGIIGTSSDAIASTAKNKLEIYSSEVKGNIEIENVVSNANLYIGGVAGSVVADMNSNSAWGNITTEDGQSNNIGKLYIGGIAAILKGKGSSGKVDFKNNKSLTSIYNKNIVKENLRENYLVRALIGESAYIDDATDSNLYCHQINLCVDVIGENLTYKSGDSNILNKFGTYNSEIGTKRKPHEITNESDFDTIVEGEYYVLTGNISIKNASKDIAGHLVGDGKTIALSGNYAFNPFGTISGYISGVRVENKNTSSNTNSGVGFANTNNGIVFACTTLFIKSSDGDIFSARRAIQSGFIKTNTGLIADCGVVLYGDTAIAGFCESNSGIILNSYATGSLTTGFSATAFSKGADGSLINCYTALKASTSTGTRIAFNGKVIDCFYDSNAAEKGLTGLGTSKATDYMSTSSNSDTANTDILESGGLKNIEGTWAQNYEFNFGYPTLSAGAYKNFDYLLIATGTGVKGKNLPVQIPNAGKLAQIDKTANTLGREYALLNNINITASGFSTSTWKPIGGNSSVGEFEGVLDGKNRTISGIPSITATTNAGFFGKSSGNISNLKLTYSSNAEVKSTTSSGTAGGLIGKMTGGTLSSVSVFSSGTIKATGTSASAGGIVGKMEGANSEIISASNTSKVEAQHYYAGGIVGHMNTTDGKIENSSNSGSIQTTGTADSCAGGIVGWMENGSITGSTTKNTGSIGGSTTTKYAGGFVGYMTTGSISGGTNQGNTVAKDYAGGIVGEMSSGTISVSSNSGNVKATTSAGGIVGEMTGGTISGNKDNKTINTGKVEATTSAGGIVGEMSSGTISVSSNSGTVEATTSAGGIVGEMTGGTISGNKDNKTINTGKVEATTSAGGIVGEMTNGTVESCTNNTSVTGTGTDSSAGGIVGYMSNGTVKACNNTESVTSKLYAGGIVGEMSIGTISESSNSGNVKATIKATGTSRVYAGGIVGYLSGGSIISSPNTSNVYAGQENGIKGLTPYAGGIAGYSNGTISGCKNSGTIRAYGYKKPTTSYDGATVWRGRSIEAISAEVGEAVFDKSEVSVTFEAKTEVAYSAEVYAGKIVGFLGLGGVMLQEVDSSGGSAYKYDYKIKFGNAKEFTSKWVNVYNPGWYTEGTFTGDWSFKKVEEDGEYKGQFKFKKSILIAYFKFSFTTDRQGVSCGNVGNE